MMVVELKQSIHGFRAMQTKSALNILKRIISDNQDVMRIVEFGTSKGGLSLFFGDLMKQRNGKVLTFDIIKPDEEWFDSVKNKPIQFKKMSVFSKRAKEIVLDFISKDKSLIFCDNGNKAKEVWTYAPLIKKGDLIMAHDWGTEITEENLNPSKNKPIETDSIYKYCKKYRQDEFDGEKTLILSMVRK